MKPFVQLIHTNEKKFKVTMALICNPSYLRGKDKESHGSRPVKAKSSQDPISNNGGTEWHMPLFESKRNKIKIAKWR
jgi:hypothetical protein